MLNPLLFAALDVILARRDKTSRGGGRASRRRGCRRASRSAPTTLKDHVVLVGHGRVGSFISGVLQRARMPVFVIEDDEDAVADCRSAGIEAISGNAADPR